MATEEIVLPAPGAIPGIAGGVQPANCIITVDWQSRQVVSIAPLLPDEDEQVPAQPEQSQPSNQQSSQDNPPVSNGG